MARRSTLTLLLLLLPLAAAACERAPTGEEEAEQGRRDFGPTAAYDRRLVFLGPGSELPTAVIFDFATLSDSVGLSRGVRARLVDGIEWVPLLDAGWSMAPMRDPWRLVPYGPLRVVVGDAGEVDALIFRGDVEIRLEAGSALAEHSPDGGTQLVLRQARLRLGDEPIPGILLDAQLGRSLSAATIAAARPQAAGPPDTGADRQAEEVVEEEEAGAEPDEPDTVGADPSPVARPGAEALLVDNGGYYAVFAPSAAGDIAWTHLGGRDDERRGARLEPTAWEMFAEAGVQVPSAWRVVSPTEVLSGELRTAAADRTALTAGTGVSALGYAIVTGWIEDRGVRREVYGLVRHVR